ncbi:MAG: S-adenosylmethionine:tRNA ribosyltransferase-isomerase [Rikenellaceae bacterium]
MIENINISEYNYTLPDERIAKFPPLQRGTSKLLIYKQGDVSHSCFNTLPEQLGNNNLLVFNNTKVIHARVIFHKATGARIEIFCLEPSEPADYERAFSTKGSCRWKCIVGNLKKWKGETLHINCTIDNQELELSADFIERGENSQIVEFSWNIDKSFGAILEALGSIPIPPYLNRQTQEIDTTRYQTVYSKFEGSVAAPTAGLHFTPEIIDNLKDNGTTIEEVTLHVGAGTFLPVKSERISEHTMHSEHFEVALSTVENLIANYGSIIAVGTTSVRTLESIPALAYRIMECGDPRTQEVIGQWELYQIPHDISGLELLKTLKNYMADKGLDKIKTSTQIMIAPSFKFRIVNRIITNFHQPKSTLLLLISAFIGEDWRKVYSHAMDNGFNFLSYGDSSLLSPKL